MLKSRDISFVPQLFTDNPDLLLQETLDKLNDLWKEMHEPGHRRSYYTNGEQQVRLGKIASILKIPSEMRRNYYQLYELCKKVIKMIERSIYLSQKGIKVHSRVTRSVAYFEETFIVAKITPEYELVLEGKAGKCCPISSKVVKK